MRLTPLILLFFLPLTQWAQQGIHSLGVDGIGDGGSFTSSFGQFAYENYFTGSSSVVEGVQLPFENNSVPPLYSLFDSILDVFDHQCYNSLVNLTVAGDDGEVFILNGANSEFIAGGTIKFLPGFHAEPGSHVHGYITTNNTFCDEANQSIVYAPPPMKSTPIENDVASAKNLSSNIGIELYPNPNHGNFTINLINFENKASATVYNMLGLIVHKKEMELDRSAKIVLPYFRKGIYFVRVVSGEEQFIKKFIVN